LLVVGLSRKITDVIGVFGYGDAAIDTGRYTQATTFASFCVNDYHASHVLISIPVLCLAFP
jgi:hypothetical protein